ncbi:DUF296 domain-containing protein [Oligoflexia bacterium]|nr:DUF296 domain-containing protein [Oligoflexia bacterium]
MQHTNTDYGYLILLEEGTEIMAGLRSFCTAQELSSGTFTAIGGVSCVELGYFNTETAQYETKVFQEQLEVLSITGNLATCDNELIIHAHIVLSARDYSVIGGHLVEGSAKPMLEVHLFKDTHAVNRVVSSSGSALKQLALKNP